MLAVIKKRCCDSRNSSELMIWLFGLVALLQSFFYWLIKPMIVFLTPILEFQWLGVLLLVVAGWLISGRQEQEEPF